MAFDDYSGESAPHKHRSFLGKIGAFLLAVVKYYLIGVGAIVTTMSILVIAMVMMCARKPEMKIEIIQGPKLLHLDLKGQIVDAAVPLEDQLIARLLGQSLPVAMDDLRLGLRRASKDKDIKALVVMIGPLSADQSSIVELRRLLHEVKESGKKVYAWGADLDTESYYLASIADEISIAPSGGLSVTGPVFQLTYVGEALRKLGVDIEVMRAGKYKNAFESFIANEPSQETMQMYSSLEESLRSFLVEDIAATRNKPVETVRAWLKQSIYTATQAKSEGLVDQLRFVDEVKETVKKTYKQKDDDIEYLGFRTYVNSSASVDEKILSKEDSGIALIEARGNIVMGGFGEQESEAIDPYQIRKEVEWALEEDDVKAVVLRIDSPGGSATASDLMWRDLKRLAEKKPLIVSLAQTAASGGYYIAVAGQKIIAEPNTITGSIGVIGAIPNFEAFREKYGVSFFVVTQTDRAKMLNPGEKSSAFDKAIIENSIEHTYRLFLERVASGRKMKVEQVAELAQGRVYSGRQALELGLVDDLGGINDAFRAAKESAGLDPNKLYSVMQYEGTEKSLSECLSSYGDLVECISELDSSVVSRRLLNKSYLDMFIDQQHAGEVTRVKELVQSRERIFTLGPRFTLR